MFLIEALADGFVKGFWLKKRPTPVVAHDPPWAGMPVMVPQELREMDIAVRIEILRIGNLAL